jgi:hypothetical protein
MIHTELQQHQDAPLGNLPADRAARARLVVAMLCLTALIVFCSLPIFSEALPPQDEGILLVYPERILAGQVPSRDFRCSYGPAGFYLIAGCFKVFGVSVAVERSVGLFYRIALVLGVGAIIGRRGALMGMLAGALAWSATLALGLTAYAWCGAAACLVWSIWCISLPKSGSAAKDWAAAVAGGFLCGLGVLFRPDAILLAIVSGVPVFCAAGAMRRRAYLCGAAVAGAMFAAYLAAASPRLVVANLLGAVSASRNLHWVRRGMSAEESVLMWLAAITASSILAIAIFRLCRDRKSAHACLLLSAGLLSLGALQQALQYPDIRHIMFAGCVAFALWPLGLAELIGPGLGRMSAARQTITAILAAAVFAALAAETMVRPAITAVKNATGLSQYSDLHVIHRGRIHPVPDLRELRDLQMLLNRVEEVTTPGDTLVVACKDLDCTMLGHTSLYFLLPQLKPATYHLEMFLGTTMNAGYGSDFYQDVQSAKVLILDCGYTGPPMWRERLLKAGGTLHPVPGQFVLRGRYGEYELYVRMP